MPAYEPIRPARSKAVMDAARALSMNRPPGAMPREKFEPSAAALRTARRSSEVGSIVWTPLSSRSRSIGAVQGTAHYRGPDAPDDIPSLIAPRKQLPVPSTPALPQIRLVTVGGRQVRDDAPFREPSRASGDRRMIRVRSKARRTLRDCVQPCQSLTGSQRAAEFSAEEGASNKMCMLSPELPRRRSRRRP